MVPELFNYLIDLSAKLRHPELWILQYLRCFAWKSVISFVPVLIPAHGNIIAPPTRQCSLSLPSTFNLGRPYVSSLHFTCTIGTVCLHLFRLHHYYHLPSQAEMLYRLRTVELLAVLSHMNIHETLYTPTVQGASAVLSQWCHSVQYIFNNSHNNN